LTIKKKIWKGKMESTTKIFERPFEELLEESVRLHGHLCAGQVLGVRLAILGLRLLGIDNPKGQDRKSFMVYVEIDRCATDAIQSVTGCSLGKRSLRWVDYGIMAATFVHLKTGKAFRIVAREESRELSRKYCPEIEDKYRRQLKAYSDLPGRPIRRVQCESCGDYVQDCREVERDGKVLCRACAHGAYYKIL
jgi:formylmethanofuran dehydrogenase subunit E